MVSTSMVGRWPRWRWSLILLGLVVAGLSLFVFSGARSLRPGATASRVARPAPALRYTLALTLAPDTEWRFTPRALDLVVYLSPADKYPRLTRRLSQDQKGLDERTLLASQRPSEPW
jgi:hypothetical protein